MDRRSFTSLASGKPTRREILLGCLTATVSACTKAPTPKASEGRIRVPGGTVVWRRFGGGPKTPLLLIHGGPGFPSDYLEPLAALSDERAVFLWDQLGCGRSDRPTDVSLWTVQRFVQELEAVRAEL